MAKHVGPGSLLYSDGEGAYTCWPKHEAVIHSRGEYVRGNVSINGLESFWALLKRSYMGTFHWMSRKHTSKYLAEFCMRQGTRTLGTLERMETVLRGTVGKRLCYCDLVA